MSFLAVDIETDGLDPRKDGGLLCIAWSDGADNRGVSDVIPPFVLDKFADATTPLVSHSIFDPVWLRRAGYTVNGPFHNTMVMAHLLNENTALDLGTVAALYSSVVMDKRLSRADNKVYFHTDSGIKLMLAEAWLQYPSEVKDYCMRDTDTLVQVYLDLIATMHERGWWHDYINEHQPLTDVLVDMECAGIPINLEDADTLKYKLTGLAERQKTNLLFDLKYDVNLNSNTQLRDVLYKKVFNQAVSLPITKDQRDILRGKEEGDAGLPSTFSLDRVGTKYARGSIVRKGLGLVPKEKTDSGAHSVSTPTLIVHYGNVPFVADLIAYRKTEKVITTYLDAYPRFSHEGRLYGRFNQTGTATGRLSHNSPNLGNQPAHGELGANIRGLFQGKLIVGDHSQLEPRLMAHFSQDPVLLDIYRTEKDIYLTVAEYIFGKKFTKEDPERQIAKTLILALGYGAGARKVAAILAVNGFWTPVDRAKEYLAHLEAMFQTFFDFKRDLQKQSKQNGFVKTIGGRYRRLQWAYDSAAYKVRNKADRQAVNAVIQGSAADVLRRNMIHCDGLFPEARLLNQVHDELIWDYIAPISLSFLREVCEQPGYALSVPLKFEPQYVTSWAEKGSGVLELPDEDE